jgi:hypothetical protein
VGVARVGFPNRSAPTFIVALDLLVVIAPISLGLVDPGITELAAL